MMKGIITTLIAVVATVLCIGIFTVNAEAVIVAVAALCSYVGFKYLVDVAYAHIVAKKYPTSLEWATYALVLLGLIFLIVGLHFHSIYCLLFFAICIIASLVCYAINGKILKKAKKN